VDASIGGKVAVDHPLGKNLIGAFKQPCAVVADIHTLATLPDVEWRSGMAEVVKNAIIGDPGLFEELGDASGLNAEKWLGRAVQVKADIVTRDPYERGERAKLNLGHTFGHALEQVSNYSMRHGDAVAIGLVCAAWLAHRLGIAGPNLRFRIQDGLLAIGLPTRIPIEMSTGALLDAMLADKKWFDGRLRFILPRGVGDVIIVDEIARWRIVQVIEDLR
jgi:3-dehydroquinate synthetase